MEFRLAHLKDPRAQAVIEAVAKTAGWQPGRAAATARTAAASAFAKYKTLATYVAVIVDVEVDRDSGKVRVPRAFAAVDSGQIINPDGLTNQIEGGIVQSTSWTLQGAGRGSTATASMSRDWQTYPILTMQEAPTVEIVLIDRPERAAARRRRSVAGPDGGGDRQCLRGSDRQAHARPAVPSGPREGGAGVTPARQTGDQTP